MPAANRELVFLSSIYMFKVFKPATTMIQPWEKDIVISRQLLLIMFSLCLNIASEML